MHQFHKELLKEIKKHAREGTVHSANDSYLSSGHRYYSVSAPVKRGFVKRWASQNKNISLSEYIALLNSLYIGESYEEKTTASLLLEYLPKLRKQLDPQILHKWLDFLVGWAEIDSLSQSNFSDKEMLSHWSIWEKLLEEFSQDKNISKRRASLVLLTQPVSHSDNKDLAKLAFKNIDSLKNGKDILITKAISWLLRSLIRNHAQRVKEYIDTNENSLPKIAIREARNKLLTGKK